MYLYLAGVSMLCVSGALYLANHLALQYGLGTKDTILTFFSTFGSVQSSQNSLTKP